MLHSQEFSQLFCHRFSPTGFNLVTAPFERNAKITSDKRRKAQRARVCYEQPDDRAKKEVLFKIGCIFSGEGGHGGNPTIREQGEGLSGRRERHACPGRTKLIWCAIETDKIVGILPWKTELAHAPSWGWGKLPGRADFTSALGLTRESTKSLPLIIRRA